MEEKILSVSIAAYNMESYLASCLDSFLEESVLRRCEVIIVDDGSTDNTAKIAQIYVERYPSTYRLISKENGGLGSAFNCALKEAHGKYFKWLDADDMFDTKGLKNLLDVLETTKADIIVTPMIRFEDKTGFLYEIEDRYMNIEKNVVLEIEDSISKWTSCGMHLMTIQTEKIREMKLPEHCFYVDMIFVVEGICCSETILFLEKPVYLYRLAREGQSVNIKGFRKHYLEHLHVVMRLLDYYKRNSRARLLLEPFYHAIINTQSAVFFKLIPSKKHFKEYLEWTHVVKKNYPELASYVMEGKKGYLLKKENFFLYRIVVKYLQYRWKRQNSITHYSKGNIKEIIGRECN